MPLTLLCTSILLSLPLSHGSNDSQQTIERVAEKIASERFTLEHVSVPSESTPSLTVEIPREGRVVPLVLERHSVRAVDFRLHAQRVDGSLVEVPAPPVSTYRGTIPGEPGTVVAAGIGPDGITAAVFERGEPSWFVQPLTDLIGSGAAGRHVVYEQDAAAFERFVCGTDHVTQLPETMSPDSHWGRVALGTNDCIQVARIAFDVDHERYLALGSDVNAVTLDVETVLNAVNVFYARDVLLRHELGDIIVRTAEPDPYTQTDSGLLLDEIRAEWNANQGAIDRDTAHLITGKPLDGSIIGLAWVAVVCNLPWAYGLSEFNFDFATHVTLVGHEVGHNWAAPHCLDPSCVIMCGGCHEFGPITAQVVMNYADSVACLDPAPGEASAIAPTVRDDAAVSDGPVVIDVLANDHDANCDTVVIDSFDAGSASGATITRSVGTGPDGRDELLYTPPALGSAGVDSFTYLAGDGTGLQTVGEVFVTDMRADLVARYRMDENGGVLLVDSSASTLHGLFQGAPGFVQGGAAARTGSSIDFDGTADHALVVGAGSVLDELTANFTVAAWIRPESPAGFQRVFGNPSAWAFGLKGDDLVFTTLGVQDSVMAATIPVDAWSHVACNVDGAGDVTFFLNGQSLGTLAGGGVPSSPGDKWYVASLDGQGEFFAGRIDDLVLFDSTLEPSQVECLYDSSSAAKLSRNPGVVSMAIGGTQDLELCGGLDEAGQIYLLLGTYHGTSPGFFLGGFHFPLEIDVYFNKTVSTPNLPPLSNSFATLDANGNGTAAWSVGSGDHPNWAGLTLHHAYVVLEFGPLGFRAVSNAVSVDLIP